MPLAQQLVRDVERRHHRDAIGAAHLAAVADLAHALVEQRDRLREFLALAFLARDLEVAAEDRDVERDAVGWVGRCCHSPLLTLGHRAATTAEVSASLAPHRAAPFGPRLGCASPAVLTLGLHARSRQQRPPKCRPHSLRAAPRPSGLGSAAPRPPCSLSASLHDPGSNDRRSVGLTRSARRRALRASARLRLARRAHSRPPCTIPGVTTAEVSASLAPHGAAPFGPRLGCASPAVLTLGLLARSRE